jgi:AraC-like DNA-binding protein
MHGRADVLAKIAAGTAAAIRDRELRGAPGKAAGTPLARGTGWSVTDFVCTCGPKDRVFEEVHTRHSVSVVLSGTFQHRSSDGRHLMSAGSFMLGTPGEAYECNHEHAAGDRCVAFHFSAEYLEAIAADLSRRHIRSGFGATRLPPARELAGAVARTAVALGSPERAAWSELAVYVGAAALSFHNNRVTTRTTPPAEIIRRITEHMRAIEADPTIDTSLDSLAAAAGLGPFAYLRGFRHLTGSTPHQFLLRTRLRRAAVRLATWPANVIDVGFSSGFEDVSNFNKAFRAEFGVTPTAYRRAASPA